MSVDTVGKTGDFGSSGKEDARQQKVIARVKRDIEKAMKQHKKRLRSYDRSYKAYKGFKEQVRGAPVWRNRTCPQYIWQVVETLEASLVDDTTVTKVAPLQPDKIKGAKALEHILKRQMTDAKYDKAKGKFTKNALIYGIAVAKVHWRYSERMVTYNDWQPDPFTGLYPDEPVEKTDIQVEWNQPVFENIDPKRFYWEPSAESMEDAAYVCLDYYVDQAWVDKMSLPILDDEGNEIEPAPWINTDKLKESKKLGSQHGEGKPGGALMPDQTDVDYSGEYCITETWYKDRVVTLGNGVVLLQDEPNPYWHGQIPFVVGCTTTELNRFEGQSEVDCLRDLQSALWQILNQQLDNAEQIVNAIVMIRNDVDDPDQYEYYPGALWFVERMDDIEMWAPNTNILGATEQLSQALKSDLQNLAASIPYLAGGAAETVDQKTATGISIISNQAQVRVQHMKDQLNYAYADAGRLWIQLNQQLLTTPQAVAIDSIYGTDFEHVNPWEIQGQFRFIITSAKDDFDRTQRRAESLNFAAWVGSFAQTVPFMQAAGINWKTIFEKVAADYDIENVDDYINSLEQTQPAGPPQLTPPPGAPTDPALAGAPPAQAPVYQAPNVASNVPLLPPPQ